MVMAGVGETTCHKSQGGVRNPALGQDGVCLPWTIVLLAMVATLLQCNNAASNSSLAPEDCNPNKRSRDPESRVSRSCRPTPHGTSFEYCLDPPWEMIVRDNCTYLPEQPMTLDSACSQTGDGPALNVSWSLPAESRRAVTGYKVTFIDTSAFYYCSFLVPDSAGQTWFLLRRYKEFLACANTINIDLVEVVSLPLKNSARRHGGRVGPRVPVSFSSCLSTATIIDITFDRCQVIHLHSNATLVPRPTTPSPTTASTRTSPTQLTTNAASPPRNASRTATTATTRPGLTEHPTTLSTIGQDANSGINTQSQDLTLVLVVIFALGMLAIAVVVALLIKRRHFAEALPSEEKTPDSIKPPEFKIYEGPITSQPFMPEYLPPSPLSPNVPLPPITPPPITNSRPHVYISYSRCDPHHRRRVRGLADWLHENGIAVVADFYYTNEMAVGPQFFVEKGVTSSTFVLAVCSEDYADVWMTDRAEDTSAWAVLQPPSMLTSWEIGLIRVCMSTLARDTPDVIPIVMLRDDEELPHVPDLVPLPLLTRRVYGLGNVATNKDQLDLLQRLHAGSDMPV